MGLFRGAGEGREGRERNKFIGFSDVENKKKGRGGDILRHSVKAFGPEVTSQTEIRLWGERQAVGEQMIA